MIRKKPPRPTPAALDSEDGLPFPRQSERIATKAQGIFLYAVGGGLAAVITWASITELDKVTRGSGRIVPQSQNQIVQHLEGGIVSEILVKEGDLVARGAVIMRIEDSFAKAELAKAHLEIDAKRVRIARLDAEAKGLDHVALPAGDLAVDKDVVAREMALFDSRRANFTEQLAILDDQIKQKELDLSQLKSRWPNTTQERELVIERVASMRRLAKAGAVSNNELIENERALSQIEAKLSDLVHDIPRTEAALSEANRRRNEATLRFRNDAESQRGDTELEISKLAAGIAALQDRSTRSDVLAPISGVVNKLYITTIGGVVKGGEPLAQLVPADAAIAVEARLSPADRAEVWAGLPAIIKISAYEYSIYGGLKAKVVDVSPDALQDDRGQPYFRVRLEANATDFGPTRPVVPGMLADVDILTGRRTILEALLRPIRSLRDNALRE